MGTSPLLKSLRPLQDFLRTEAAGGALVVVGIIVALTWVNGPFSASYDAFWHHLAAVEVAGHRLEMDLRHLVNDGLMTLFFLIIGLEVKREFVEGEMRDPRKAAVPIIAALGGMVVPALVYAGFNPPGSEAASGWAIPMATDVAIALGVLALLGKRVPTGLKVFLLTLAIVDDVGAIIVIALFYSSSLDLQALLVALGTFGAAVAFRYAGLRSAWAYLPFLAVVWFSLYRAGIHPTLAGVAFGLLATTNPFLDRQYVDAEKLADVSTTGAAVETVSLARQSVSVVEWLQHRLHPWTSYAVLPLFAVANAGVLLGPSQLEGALASSVAWGAAAGLVLGKALGISFFTLIALRIGLGRLPSGVSAMHVVGMSALAGIGFTVSIFVAELAFDQDALVSEAKVGVLVASSVAALIGALLLWRAGTKEKEVV